MPTKGKTTQVTEDGKEKKSLQISFTNGALEQLEALQENFKLDDPTKVVELGISYLQKIKESISDEKK